MTKEFRYAVPPVGQHEFPRIGKEKGAIISCEVHPGNEVQIVGNSDGLIYLAKYLAAMALLEKRDGCHVHLDPQSGDLETGSALLTICNLEFGGNWDRFKQSE
jgi:hypothetical protein